MRPLTLLFLRHKKICIAATRDIKVSFHLFILDICHICFHCLFFLNFSGHRERAAFVKEDLFIIDSDLM